MKTIYKYSKPNCPPCAEFQPVWESLKVKFKTKDIQWVEVDVSTPEGMKMAVERGVRSVPTFLSNDGFRKSGAITEQDFIDTFLKNESGWL